MGLVSLTTAEAFLADIIANPRDDAPRMIFADWLDENGEGERASFIRVQCELAQRRRGPVGPVPEDSPWLQGDEVYQQLRRRERELLVDLWGRGDLTHGLPGVQYHTYRKNDQPVWAMSINGSLIELDFCRGFVATVQCSLAAWQMHGPVIVLAQPVEEVRVTDRGPTPRTDASAGQFGWFGTDNLYAADCLPLSLWQLLRGGEKAVGVAWRFYESLGAANAAISTALLTWAKGFATMPAPTPLLGDS